MLIILGFIFITKLIQSKGYLKTQKPSVYKRLFEEAMNIKLCHYTNNYKNQKNENYS